MSKIHDKRYFTAFRGPPITNRSLLSLMAGNNTSGQDSRLPGASQQFPIAPDDSIEPEGGRTSAEVYKKPRRSTASKEGMD